jgi:hypothetical protein
MKKKPRAAIAATLTRATGRPMRSPDEDLLLLDFAAAVAVDVGDLLVVVPDVVWCAPDVVVADVDNVAAAVEPAVVAVYSSPETPIIACATPDGMVTVASVAQLHWPLTAQQYEPPPQLVISPEISSSSARRQSGKPI